MEHNKFLTVGVCVLALMVCNPSVYAADNAKFEVLQQITDKPTLLTEGQYKGFYYVPSTVENVMWGYLPNRTSKPLLTVPSGSTVVFDTISHEGVLEDQGRDAAKYFKSKGVEDDEILPDAVALTSSNLKHNFDKDGPHVVVGPVAIEGAEKGDVLKVEVIEVNPRVPYGVISNRHGKGTLPDEYPVTPRREGASAKNPELYGNLSVFSRIYPADNGKGYEGRIETGDGKAMRFPLKPFMGIMGVAPDTDKPVNSVPPAFFGGNIDIADLGVGSTVYYPVMVPGALFYTGDGHFVQGDGEVALTALEGSNRAVIKFTLLKKGIAQLPGKEISQVFGETSEFWITPGLDEDLNVAMQKSTRASIDFIANQFGIDKSLAYAYLSAATDFHVSQVVDRTKGIHGLIRKSDFRDYMKDDTKK